MFYDTLLLQSYEIIRKISNRTINGLIWVQFVYHYFLNLMKDTGWKHLKIMISALRFLNFFAQLTKKKKSNFFLFFFFFMNSIGLCFMGCINLFFFCKFQKDEYRVCLPRLCTTPNLRWLFEVCRLWEFPQIKQKIFFYFFL